VSSVSGNNQIVKCIGSLATSRRNGAHIEESYFMKIRIVSLSVALFVGSFFTSSVGLIYGKVRSVSTQANYVPAEQFNTVPFMPAPAADSEVWKNDTAVMLDWQGKRTDADCERANNTFIVTFPYFWGENSPFPQPLPAKVQNFFDRLDSDIGNVARVMKNRCQRPRPKVYNPCPGPSSRGYSYPSGHAAMSRVFAYVLTDIVPERKAGFFAKADQIAFDRVIIGVHYPSDIAAGKVLGEIFHDELLKSYVYLNDLEKIKTFLVK